jgi:small subunit ribosomal protein S17
MSKRVLQGVVVSDSCDKTVIVRVERRVMHPVYKKFVTHSKKYAAHDENNSYRAGDIVRIEESRPISKRKCWIVLGGPADAAPGGRLPRTAAVNAPVEADASPPEPQDQEPQDPGPPHGDHETVETAGGAA